MSLFTGYRGKTISGYLSRLTPIGEHPNPWPMYEIHKRVLARLCGGDTRLYAIAHEELRRKLGL